MTSAFQVLAAFTVLQAMRERPVVLLCAKCRALQPPAFFASASVSASHIASPFLSRKP